MSEELSHAERQPLSNLEIMVLKEQIFEQLRTVFDPEIPVNIYDLGLIYEVAISEKGEAKIKMTLTSPACPAAQSMPPEVKQKAELVKGIVSADVEVVWEPRWETSMMSEEAKLTLGF
jgi:FeS assembly SUF system protein